MLHFYKINKTNSKLDERESMPRYPYFMMMYNVMIRRRLRVRRITPNCELDTVAESLDNILEMAMFYAYFVLCTSLLVNSLFVSC